MGKKSAATRINPEDAQYWEQRLRQVELDEQEEERLRREALPLSVEDQIETCYSEKPTIEFEGILAYADVADQLVDDPMPAASRVPMMLTA